MPAERRRLGSPRAARGRWIVEGWAADPCCWTGISAQEPPILESGYGVANERSFRERPDGPAVYGMRIALAWGLLASSIAATSCVVNVDSQALIEREEKRFSVKGTPNLRLSTFDGAIEVRSWDRPDVLVEIEKRGPTREAVDGLVVQVEQDGNKIAVEVKRPKSETFSGLGFHRSASAKLIVSVPQSSDVAARSGDGSIRIEP